MMKLSVLALLLSFLASPAQLLAADATATEASDDPVFVVINGVEITESEVKNFMSRGTTMDNPQDAVREMINVELINQAARREGLLQDEALQREIRQSQAKLIASTYMRNYLAAQPITDEQIEARYRSEFLDEDNAREFNANHILVQTEEEATAIIEKLDQGTDFAALAKAFSTAPSANNGGALGWFKKKNMVAPFSAATAGLAKGSYSKTPVQTKFGWHVILLNDTRTIEAPALDAVRQDIAGAITGDRLRQKLEELEQAATIKMH